MRGIVPGGALVTLSAALCLSVPTRALGQPGLAEAETAFRSGRYDKAIAAFTDLARRWPDSAQAVRGQVRALMRVGRYEDAEAAARRFTEAADAPELWNTLGEVLYRRGEWTAAEEAFRAAVASDASDALTARLNLAVLRFRRGQLAEAMRDFDGFIDVYNRGGALDSQELTAVGTAVRYLGRRDPQLFKDALRAYDEAIAADPDNLEPRVAVGELFLEKYNSADAAASFADVLEMDPSHPRALLGEARRLRFEGMSGSFELVRRSLEVNPDFVEAQVFLAEHYIDLEEYDEAEREVERALRVNPASLEALAVLAAARYLGGDEGGYDDARRRALALNPRYAGLYTRLADLSARNRLYGQAVEFAGRAVELDQRSWRGYALLGINQLRVGAIEDGRRNLETAFAGDPYDLWTKNTLDLLDKFESYEERRTDRFVLAIDGTESELLTLYLAGLAEEAYERLVERYGFRPETPIRVELYRHHADFSVRTAGLVGFDALGVSFGPVIAMDSPSARAAGAFHWGSTFWHELAHTFHLGLSGHRVPRWFSEGLAVYEQRQARPGWGNGVTPGFLRAYREGRLLPVGDLNNGFTRPSYPEQVSHSYYQASLVCELIERQAGWEALVGLLRAFREGQSVDQAFRSVLGMGVGEVSDRFFEYLEDRFAMPLAALAVEYQLEHGERPGPELLARWVKEEPGSFYAQLSYGRLLLAEGDLEGARRHLERAKALFPQYAGPENPYWYLAQVHKRLGSSDRAAAELAHLTALNGEDLRANLELAELQERLGDVRGAANALERAVNVYPFDVEPHLRLADLYARLDEHRAEIRERRAVLALDPVDRADALYRLARAYYAAGDLDAARKTVLEALEVAPSFDAALELLLEVRGTAGGRTTGSGGR